ncbi:MAG: outer membrane beta-barrel protein [Flavobacteriales bacterium]|nr:outer membrane beta-barrel protein [Flavobacteriales bacterium]
MIKYYTTFFLFWFTLSILAQEVKIDNLGKNLTFTGTEVIENDDDYDSTGQLVLSGYVSSYYAYYNDSVGTGNYQKLPTTAPYSDKFGLNIVQLGGVYTSDNFRGIFTFQIGDIPQSAWSSQYNMIQEANAGYKIIDKLWFDIGFFRTHIGLESIQPRENIASSIASTTYFEPYFLSGAKLTYQFNKKIALQANVFNSFNTFVETNKNKAVGLSAVINPNDKLSITINTITCDESPEDFPRPQQRLYNNLYMVYRSDKIDIGAEYNFGLQQNSQLTDTTKTAYMHSALFALKYKFNKKYAVYGREEFFTDPDEILTGPIQNSHHELVGMDIIGTTLGVEVKPIENSYVRLEGRTLHTKTNEDIFLVNHKNTNHREEVIFSVGVWF